MNKSELRKIYLAAQKNLCSEESNLRSAQIAERFFAAFDLAKIKFLHVFIPIEKFNEIDTTFIVEKIRRDFPHIETVAPRVNFQTMEMESVKFTAATEFARNSWHIREPHSFETIENKKIDLVVVPLLCFDQNGFRVGYGKGFYDRFLRETRHDCRKIGLNYFAPVEKIFDVGDFDIKLDYTVTPESIFRFDFRTD